MSRVEYKIREVKSDWLEKALLKYGARKIFEDEVFTTYYDRIDGNFMKLGKRLTVSKQGDAGVLSFKDKYNSPGIGVSNEITVEVLDPLLMDKVMVALGFTHFKTFKKFRKEYQYDSITLTFDKYREELDFIPEFLIIEADKEKDAFEWAEKLGYKEESLKVTTVLELIKYYKDLSDKVEGSASEKGK